MIEIAVTPRNFPAFNRAEQLLQSHLEELVRMTERYPVECTFAGVRFIFRSREDIVDAIKLLDRKLAEYRRESARPAAAAVSRH